MFKDPLYRQLHTRIARLIVAYDVIAHPYFLRQADTWIHDAEAQHIQVLVAFYHSEYSPTRLPSVALYQHDVQKFIKRFPHVKQYQSWDESNRGNVPRAFSSPSAELGRAGTTRRCCACAGAARCSASTCSTPRTSAHADATSREFKREIGRLRTVMPTILGPAQLLRRQPLRKLAHARTGQRARRQVWLTETGGIVQFKPSFPNVHGSGLSRAAQGAEVHVLDRERVTAHQAPVHLRLDRRRQLDALRRRPDGRPLQAAARLRGGLPAAARRRTAPCARATGSARLLRG